MGISLDWIMLVSKTKLGANIILIPHIIGSNIMLYQ